MDKDRGEDELEKELLELAGYTEVYEEGASKDEHQDNSEQLDHSSYAIAMSDTALLYGELPDHIDPLSSSIIGRSQDDVSEPHTHECPSTTVSQASSSFSCSSIERANVVGTAEHGQSNGITQTSEGQLVSGSYRNNPRYREIMAKWNANQAKIALLLIPVETAHDTPSESTQDEVLNRIKATSEMVGVLNDHLVEPTLSTEDKATGAIQRIRPLRRELQLPNGVAGAVESQDWLVKFHADSLRRKRMRNAEDEALRRQRENATQRPSRLCRIGMIATRICRFINDWEAQVDKNLPEALCESVEVLVDAYRYMDRTDSGRTLKDIRQLRRQWISMRRVIQAYKYIALSFDLYAREKIEHLYHAFKSAPHGSQQQAKLTASLKKKLNTMAKRHSKFLEVGEELRDRAPDLLQHGVEDMIKATLDECSAILGRVRMVFNMSAPGVAAATFSHQDGL
ncbi:hypothetical protein BDU57DRAFT_523162 [Ampelomyces quisqualis]|uniref:Uncharacterized protein n=1 Tax=Ampelomyces quisqualis TaxID=50730 RepID=A0A6A5QB33_AMPQU|nr:hypothetical protein BDU57DRAFT_523162 [Ampelomyces quisqualis]